MPVQPQVHTHIHLPKSIAAILVGLALMIGVWFFGVNLIGFGWSTIVFIIGLALVIIGFLRLLK